MTTAAQQHWDGVLWPGKLASTAGYHPQATEADDECLTEQHYRSPATELEAKLDPFEQGQQQQQQGYEVTPLQVEAVSSSDELEPLTAEGAEGGSGSPFAALSG